jgi:hypothetical protein
MNWQQRTDKRSMVLHQAIAQKLLIQPQLWAIPYRNISHWRTQIGSLPPALQEWEKILHTWSYDSILKLLTETSQSATRLRSSSPFAGVLTEQERLKIFRCFSAISPIPTVKQNNKASEEYT